MGELKRILAATVAASALSLVASAAAAQECPRGDLDARYCDADGDMIADVPTDESQLWTPIR